MYEATPPANSAEPVRLDATHVRAVPAAASPDLQHPNERKPELLKLR